MLRRSLGTFLRKRRTVTTCALQLEPPPAPSLPAVSNDHRVLCFSLVEKLVQRGLLSFAKRVIRRMIAQAPSASEAISAFEYLVSRGLAIDLDSYGSLLEKLVLCGEYQLAEALYNELLVDKGVEPNSCMLSSMIVCFSDLGRLDEAKSVFERCLELGLVPDMHAFSAIFRQFCTQEMFLDAFDCFTGLSNAGVRIDLWCYNHLINGLCSKGYLDEAIEVFCLQQDRTKFLPTLHQYKSMFYGLCKGGRIIEAELLSGEMESQGFFIDKIMYTSLIYGYSKDRKMKMAMRVFLKMLKMGYLVDNYIFNTLIYGFTKLGLFDKGWAIYKKMVESGLQPDAVTYHMMISNYCREGKTDDALNLLKHMVIAKLSPSVHSYTALIAALFKEKKLTDAYDLCKSMSDNGIVPDHVFFFVVMKMQPKGHELELAHVILQDIAIKVCQHDHSFFSDSQTVGSAMSLKKRINHLIAEIAKVDLNLGSVAFGIYICALCQRGDMEAALLSLEKLVSIGCRPLLFTYNSLIKGLYHKGIFDDAESLIYLMEDQGLVPDLETYLIKVSEHCKRGDLESAYGALEQINERGLKPSVAIYDSIIGCLGKKKRILEAEEMFRRMLEAGIDPDEIVYMTMIDAYAKNRRTLEACELFEKMIENAIQPSSYSYTALISGLIKKNIEKGCIYLNKMIGDGYEPNNVLYTSLINHFLKVGDIEFAFKLVSVMARSQIECDLVTYIVLLSGIGRHISGIKRRWGVVSRGSEKARKMLLYLLQNRSISSGVSYLKIPSNSPEEMKHFALTLLHKIKAGGADFMPNLYLYNGLISGFCGANMIQDAYHHFYSMQKEGLHPNQVTFTILMKGHISRGEIDSAVSLFNKMNEEGCPPDTIAYNTLLRGLCDSGRLLDALSLAYTMHKRGFFPNEVSYRHLLNHLCAIDWNIHAFKIFEEMLSHNFLPSHHSCNWLLSSLCTSGKQNEAQVVYALMLRRNSIGSPIRRFVVDAVP